MNGLSSSTHVEAAWVLERIAFHERRFAREAASNWMVRPITRWRFVLVGRKTPAVRRIRARSASE